MVDPGRDVMCTVNYLFPNVHYFLPSVQWEMLGKNKKRNRLPIFLSLGSFVVFFFPLVSVFFSLSSQPFKSRLWKIIHSYFDQKDDSSPAESKSRILEYISEKANDNHGNKKYKE